MVLNIVELFRVLVNSISSLFDFMVSVPGAQGLQLPLYLLLGMGVVILGAVASMLAWARTHR